MRCRLLLAVLSLSALPLLAAAQSPLLELPSFEGLKAKATQSVDITIGSTTLGLVSGLVPNQDRDSAELKKALGGLKSIQVRSYQFASDAAYSQADIDRIRAQLAAPGWSRLVHTQDSSRNEDVDICVALEGHTVKGLAIVASRPREFTIVNIVGTIDLKEVAKVQKHLGLPGPVVGRNLAYDM